MKRIPVVVAQIDKLENDCTRVEFRGDHEGRRYKGELTHDRGLGVEFLMGGKFYWIDYEDGHFEVIPRLELPPQSEFTVRFD